MSSDASLGRRTAVGMLWAYGSYVGGRLLVLVSTAILARLLTPKEFGVVAAALVFTTLLDTISDLGLTEALIVEDDQDIERRASTAFALSLGVGVVLCAATGAFAPLAAEFFDQPQLTAILPVLGANFVLRALGTTHYALAQKRLDFRARTAAELADVITRGTAGIALAIAGAGAWSLVLGYVLGSTAFVSTLWLRVRWRPGRPSRARIRPIIAFGGVLTVLDVTSVVVSNTDYTAIGRQLGAAQLGLYTLGFRLPELLLLNLSAVASRVLYPAFATLDTDGLGRAFRVALRFTLMLVLPIAAILATLAGPIILGVFGDRWTGSIEVMRYIALYCMFVAIEIPAGTVYKASRRAALLLVLGIPRLAVVIVAVLLSVDGGIVDVARTLMIVSAVFCLLGTALACIILRTSPREVLAAAAPPVLAAAAMVAPMILVGDAIDSPWPALVLGALLGVGVYAVVLMVVGREAVRQLGDLVLPRLRRVDRASS